MAYAQALNKAWDQITERCSVKFLNDTYDVDPEKRLVLSVSCNVPAKEHVSIIVLHYLIRKLSAVPMPVRSGEWVSFNQIEGGEGYYPTFRKRTIDVILRKYGTNPDGLLDSALRLGARRAGTSDAGLILEPLEGVPIMITVWKGDSEFGPDANILFDRKIADIFCTEDIVVLAEFVTHSL